MRIPVNIMAVPEHIRYEKWAKLLTDSFCSTFILREEIKYVTFRELVSLYRNHVATTTNNFADLPFIEFKNHIDSLLNENNDEKLLYKEISFYLSLFMGEENSIERSHIADATAQTNAVKFNAHTYDDYICSPDFLCYTNDFLKEIQKNCAILYKK